MTLATEAKKPVRQKKKRRKYPKSDLSIKEKRMDNKHAVLIKLRAHLQCKRCKHRYRITENDKIPGGLQCSHRFSRRHRNTRWSYKNCYSLCGGCHTHFDANKEFYDEWLIEQKFHTRESLDILRHLSNTTFRGDRTLIEMWINQELEKVLFNFQQLNYSYLNEFYI